MARDIFVLGEIGNAASVEMEVLEFAENTNYRNQSGPFDENRRGGFTYPRRYGPTQITCEVFLKSTGSTVIQDELDLLFGTFRSKIYTLTQTGGFLGAPTQGTGNHLGLIKLWTMDDYYYEVTLENIVERERTMFSVHANVSFIAPKGLKIKSSVVTVTLGNAGIFTWTGNVAPDVYIDVVTAIGVPVTINACIINPISAGIITLDCTRGKAYRGAASAQSELTNQFPSFFSPSTAITLAGVATIDVYFQESIL